MGEKQDDGLQGATRQTTQCLRGRAVAEMLDVSERTLRRKVATGEFPRPIRLGKGTTRWRLRDVEAWLNRPRSR